MIRLSPADEESCAALNLYSGSPDTFDEHASALASLYGLQAALLLDGAGRIDDLAAGLDGRAAVERARGVLMERFGVDADDARAMLEQVSRATGTGLADVARWVTR